MDWANYNLGKSHSHLLVYNYSSTSEIEVLKRELGVPELNNF